MLISAPLVNSFSLFLLLQKMVVVTDTICMPGERSKSPNPWLQSLHAKSVSLPSCAVELICSCQPARRMACTPRAGSLFAFQLLPALQHACRCAPAGFAPASPNRSRAQSCQVASASLQVGQQRKRRGIPGSPDKGRKSRQRGERKCRLEYKCWPRLGGIKGKQLF